MALPPTPWLNPPDYTGAFLRGAQIGASATESHNRLQAGMAEASMRAQIAAQQESARLAQQSALAQQKLQNDMVEAKLRAATQIQIADQRNAEQKQRIAIDAAYKNSLIGLQQQKVADVHAKMEREIKAAADRQMAAADVEKMVESGVPRLEAWMKVGTRSGATPNALIRGAMEMNRATPPTSLQSVPVLDPSGTPIPGMIGVPRGGAAVARNIPSYTKPGAVPVAAQFHAKRYRDQLKPIEDRLNRIGTPPAESRKAEWESLNKQRNELLDKINRLVPEPGVDTGSENDDSGWQDVEGFRVRVKQK